MNNLENIKNILTDYEVEYDHQDWLKLEKDLPKSPGISTTTKLLMIAAAIILSLGTAYILLSDNSLVKPGNKISHNNTTNQNSNTIISNDTEIDNNSDINNQTNNTINNNTENNKDNNNQTENSIIITADTNNDNSTNNNDSTTNEESTIEKIEIIEVNTELPDLSNIEFIVTINNECTPAKITFEATNIPESCKVIWNTGENYRVYGNNAEYTYIETGDFFPEVNVIYNNFILKHKKLKAITIHKTDYAKINFENTKNLYFFTSINQEELTYLWTINNEQFDERDVNYNFNKSADYLITLSVINEFGCKTTVSEKVEILIEHVFYLPNAFIPNSNGVNSNFGPIGENMDYSSYQLIIVDGNGKLVFQSNNIDFTWNGKIDNIGPEAKAGFYLWEVKTIDDYGNIQTKKGRVNLIRN